MKRQVLLELQRKAIHNEENTLDKSLSERGESKHFKQNCYKGLGDILVDRLNLKLSFVINFRHEEAKTSISLKESLQYLNLVEAIEFCYLQ